MNLGQIESWARSGKRLPWVGDLRELGMSLRSARRESGRLLLTGHPDDPPWHLAAHLDTLARFGGVTHLAPTLVTSAELATADRSDTLVVVSEHAVPTHTLERVHDARNQGCTVFSLSSEDAELETVSHESVRLDLDHAQFRGGLFLPDFEVASHLFGVFAARPTFGWKSLFQRNGRGDQGRHSRRDLGCQDDDG